MLEGLEALQLVPTSYDASSEAVFVYGLYVVRSDRTVQVVTFYVNPHLASHGSECTKLAMRSAGTLRTGPKSFDRSAHSWTLTIDGQRHVEVAMPVDTSVVTQQGPDFFVHRIHQWVRFGGSGAGGIMYFGGHPSSSVPDDAKITAGTLLGLKAEWGSYVKDSRTLVEALVPLGDHFFAHAVLNGPEGANLSLLRNALGAAQLP